MVNMKIGDVDAYATSDLFTPHPTLPGYWKIYGRADDQLMHNSGEKVREIISVQVHVLTFQSTLDEPGTSRQATVVERR